MPGAAPSTRGPAALAALALAAGLALGQNAGAPDATLRIMLDTSLKARQVRLESIGESGLVVRDVNGRRVQVNPGEVIALLPERAQSGVRAAGIRWVESTGDAGVAPLGRLATTDGQSLPGRLGSEEPGRDELVWNSTLWGTLRIALDDVRTLELRPAPQSPPPAQAGPEDVVDLVNGDRLTGFVDSIGNLVTGELGGVQATIPAERIGRLSLANPSREPAGVMVWLHDGSIVSLASFAPAAPGRAMLVGRHSESASIDIDAEQIRAVSFAAERLRGLAELPLATRPHPQAAASRRWTPAAAIGDRERAPLHAPDIELPGPMIAEWTLPENATRIAATLVLPPPCRVWGDCEVIIELIRGGEVLSLQRTRLNGETPVADLSARFDAAPGGSLLRITVDPGPSGPIQDRVLLERPLVLLD